MDGPVYQLRMPEERLSCAVFNSPHSGSDYSSAFAGGSALGPLMLRSSEDAFVDELFASAPSAGAPLMAATMPRAFLDLNRAADDLDPALISGAARRFLNPRIAAGLGVIPRVVAEGRPIISGKLTLPEAQRRIATWWHPYHARLRELLAEQREMFGMAILFDCHSMPRDAVGGGERRPNLVLGDRFGTSCDRWLVEAATEIFTAAGFVVGRNAPFAGGYITQAYGRPTQRIHALQIEIDRSLYMDEERIERGASFGGIRAALGRAVGELCALGPGRMRVAAE